MRKEGLPGGMRNLPGNSCDGHTLPETIDQLSVLFGQTPKVMFADTRYRGINVDGVTIWRSGQKRGVTPFIARPFIDEVPVNPPSFKKTMASYVGTGSRVRISGAFNAVLCGAGHNLRMILRTIDSFHAWKHCACMAENNRHQLLYPEFRRFAVT